MVISPSILRLSVNMMTSGLSWPVPTSSLQGSHDAKPSQNQYSQVATSDQQKFSCPNQQNGANLTAQRESMNTTSSAITILQGLQILLYCTSMENHTECLTAECSTSR